MFSRNFKYIRNIESKEECSSLKKWDLVKRKVLEERPSRGLSSRIEVCSSFKRKLLPSITLRVKLYEEVVKNKQILKHFSEFSNVLSGSKMFFAIFYNNCTFMIPTGLPFSFRKLWGLDNQLMRWPLAPTPPPNHPTYHKPRINEK